MAVNVGKYTIHGSYGLDVQISIDKVFGDFSGMPFGPNSMHPHQLCGCLGNGQASGFVNSCFWFP